MPFDPPSPWVATQPLPNPAPGLCRLEKIAKISQAIGQICAVAAPIAFFAVGLMTSRYLGAFGQPGLSSLGDVVSYLTAIWPLVMMVILLASGFSVLPLLTRWLSRAPSPHAFRRGFGWLRRGRSRIGLGLLSYAMANAPTLTLALLVAFAPLAPWVGSYGVWLCPIAALASLVWAMARVKGDNPHKRASHRFWSILILYMANFAFVVWLAAINNIVLDAVKPNLDRASPGLSALVSVGVVLGLVGLHMILNAVRWRAAVFLVAIMALTTLAACGDRVIMALALRYAGLGGVPLAYRAPDAKPGAASQVACLVLAVGDTRILWLPPTPKTDAQPRTAAVGCGWADFRDRVRAGGKLADAADLAAADRVVVAPRQALETMSRQPEAAPSPPARSASTR